MNAIRTIASALDPRIGTDVPLALVGPTATGKTEASIRLARRLEAEIVLVDSMTVYRGMDVGTAKPSPEERAGVPHHLLDVADPVEPFSVVRFQALAREALAGISDRGRPALLVGGSGLYYRAVVDDLEFPGTDPAVRGVLQAEAAAIGPEALHRRLAGFDPRAAAGMEPSNARRAVRALEVAALTGRPFSSFARAWDRYPGDRVRAAGVTMLPDVLRARIEARVRRQIEGGLVDEVRGLLDRGFAVTATQAIGYVEMAEHLAGGCGLEEAAERMVRRTRSLARRQLAWFRRDPRVRWFEAGPEGAVELVDEIEERYLG
ncbi:MAG: tRNA (adenosine(37)-N6)-dimethylallyltransferase MiaA [Actinomycetota bacterium]